MMRRSCVLLLCLATACAARSLLAEEAEAEAVDLSSCGDVSLEGTSCQAAEEASLAPPEGSVAAMVLTAQGLQTLRCSKGKWAFYDAQHMLYKADGTYAGYFTVIDRDGDAAPTLFLVDADNKTTGSMELNRSGAVDLFPEDPDDGAWYRRPVTNSSGLACDMNLAYANKLDTVGGGAGTTMCIEDRFGATKSMPVNATYVLYACAPKAEDKEDKE